jgi:hypothetical protein
MYIMYISSLDLLAPSYNCAKQKQETRVFLIKVRTVL